MLWMQFSITTNLGFPDSSVGKEFACNAGGPGSISGLGRSAGEGIGYPLQYSGLENSMDCIVHGDRKELDTSLSLHFTSSLILASAFHFDFHPMRLEVPDRQLRIGLPLLKHSYLLTSPDLLVSILTTAGTLLR